MYEKLLPIGSVVLLKEGNKRVMICGRIQAQLDKGQIYDYVACYYPEGIIDSNKLFFFNRDDIAMVFFVGFQDQEELKFKSDVLAKIGELEVKDGKVVQKDAPAAE